VPVLLVTNDDGVHAAGLAALAGALEDLGEVHVLAPEREQSACGHALTLHRPLSVHGWGERRHSVNGTPSDCVNLGVLGFLPERPVLVVSGINHGSNLGDDVTYSGTVSAAMEGTLLGVPSIAISLVEGDELEAAARIARQVAMRVLVSGLPPMTLLNVNVPAARRRRAAHAPGPPRLLGQDRGAGRSARPRALLDRRGPPAWEALDGTDMGAVHEGYASVTPLHLDLTHHRALAQMTDWEPALNAALRARPRAEPVRAASARAKSGKRRRR